MSEVSGSRQKVFGVASAFLGVVIALALVEVALNVFKPSINPAGQMDEGFILYDSRLGWKLAPGWSGRHRHHDFEVRYSVNSLGFRENAMDFARPGSVMFLGDSFTFGLGVNEDELFTERLDESSDQTFLNAGVPGYSTDQQLLLLDQLLQFRPDRLVWVVYLGNDLLDNGEPFPLQAAHGKPFMKLQSGGGLDLQNVPVPLVPKPKPYHSRSVQSEILDGFDPYMFWQPWIDGLAIGRIMNQWVGIDSKGLGQHLLETTDDQVELFMAIIGRGHSILEDSGTNLSVVLLPGQGFTRKGSIPAVYQKTMASILERRLKGANIPVTSLVEPLEALDNPGQLFHPNEGHLNSAGHKWLAETLSNASVF